MNLGAPSAQLECPCCAAVGEFCVVERETEFYRLVRPYEISIILQLIQDAMIKYVQAQLLKSSEAFIVDSKQMDYGSDNPFPILHQVRFVGSFGLADIWLLPELSPKFHWFNSYRTSGRKRSHQVMEEGDVCDSEVQQSVRGKFADHDHDEVKKKSSSVVCRRSARLASKHRME
jgi:hypothetical protein